MNRLPFAAIVVALAHLAVACTSKPPTQPSVDPPVGATPAPVTLKTFIIASDARFAAVGETSQLTGTATFTDGSTTDVTSAAKWFVSDPSVMSVSPSGLATALQFGFTYVYAAFEGKGGTLRMVVTPPGTFTVSGSVREPGYYGLGNVRVLDMRSGRSTTTSVEGFSEPGEFSFGDLTQDARLRIEPDGYEPVEIDAPADGPSLDVKLQRIVRVTAGETAHPVTPLAFDDLEYTLTSGARCVPCRLIRIDVPVAGTLHLRLTAGSMSLALWANGQQYLLAPGPFVVDVDVPASAGETLVYVQFLSPRRNQSQPITLDTSLKP